MQPFVGHLGALRTIAGGDAAKNLGKNLIEPVEQPFVFHKGRSGEIIECLGRLFDHGAIER